MRTAVSDSYNRYDPESWAEWGQFRRRHPLPDFANEAGLADWVLSRLDPWFIVEREVVGSHCAGRRLRIDAVLRPRDSSGWKDDAPAFGVEFKVPGVAKGWGTKDVAGWIAQAVDYTHTDWAGYGRLRVFTCPSYLTPVYGIDVSARYFLAHLLGQFGVGELCLIETGRGHEGLALLMHGYHILWSELRGVAQARYWSLRPRSGSR